MADWNDAAGAQSPAPSSSAAAAATALPSIIPARKPKRPGMPKLLLPPRPSSSSSSTPAQPPLLKLPNDAHSAAASGSATPAHLAAAGGSSSSSMHPSLSLSIPMNNSFSSLGNGNGAGSSDGDEGFEGSAGTTLSGLPYGGAGTVAATIYPDTVPFASGAQDPQSMANDLRRAIGQLKVEENASFAGAEKAVRGSDIGAESTPSNGSGNHTTLRIPTSSAASASPETRSDSDEIASKAAPGKVGLDCKTNSACRELEEESELDLRGNLEVLGRLGEGASGEVRRARYKPTGMVMAMKTISTSPNPAIHRQILRELAFNRSCHSEYIVRYYGAFLADEDTSIVICMEQCEAGSLDSIYKRVKQRNGRMGEKILAKIAESGLKGLAYLHERKIIHRDIKPSNILVTRRGQIKLCDFGVSGELIDSIAGTFTGTSYYMAPERIKGMPYTITSDVWSLGLTVLELASNRFPFPAEGEAPLGPIDLLSYVINMKVPELKDDPDAGIRWTKAFRDYLEHCFEKDGSVRHGPTKMLNHPWMKKAMAREPQPDVAKFVANVWGWHSPVSPTIQTASPVSASTVASAVVAENVNVPGLGRVASIRKAPSPVGPMMMPALRTPDEARSRPATASSAGDANSSHDVVLAKSRDGSSSSSSSSTGRGAARRHAGLSILVEKGAVNSEGIDEEGRTAQDRAIARQREADVGLIGSPTREEVP